MIRGHGTAHEHIDYDEIGDENGESDGGDENGASDGGDASDASGGGDENGESDALDANGIFSSDESDKPPRFYCAQAACAKARNSFSISTKNHPLAIFAQNYPTRVY